MLQRTRETVQYTWQGPVLFVGDVVARPRQDADVATWHSGCAVLEGDIGVTLRPLCGRERLNALSQDLLGDRVYYALRTAITERKNWPAGKDVDDLEYDAALALYACLTELTEGGPVDGATKSTG